MQDQMYTLQPSGKCMYVCEQFEKETGLLTNKTTTMHHHHLDYL